MSTHSQHLAVRHAMCSGPQNRVSVMLPSCVRQSLQMQGCSEDHGKSSDIASYSLTLSQYCSPGVLITDCPTCPAEDAGTRGNQKSCGDGLREQHSDPEKGRHPSLIMMVIMYQCAASDVLLQWYYIRSGLGLKPYSGCVNV